MRRPLIAGNWKMNKTVEESDVYLAALRERVGTPAPEVCVLVPFPALVSGRRVLAGSPVRLGAQHMHEAEGGAFTGEVSVRMLAAIGVDTVLVGHSERRVLFGETDEGVRRKLRSAWEHGLSGIVCCGESLETRRKGQEENWVRGQLDAGLPRSIPADPSRLVIAYEPVWAIGTGETAAPHQAQAMCACIRGFLGERLGEETAGAVRILYGGSVNPVNIRDLMALPDVDGVLAGGASLALEEFMALVEYGA